MSTTPLPPLPEPYQEALTPFWAYTAGQLRAYATQARADLEAENQRLREALTHAVEIAENKRPGTWDDLLQYRTALKETP